MHFREAAIPDIPQIQAVRHSVKENVLPDPAMVTDRDCEEYLSTRGRGWVCELDGRIVGFAIVDLRRNNVWALFVRPEVEGHGIGGRLHEMMLDWYFRQTRATLWLGTEPGTRAERFYRKQGWREAGTNGPSELRFEMACAGWQASRMRGACG